MQVKEVTVKKERTASPKPRQQAAMTPVKQEAQRALPHLRPRAFTCVAESSDDETTQDDDDSDEHAAARTGGGDGSGTDDGGGDAADNAPRMISLEQLSVHSEEESRAADGGRGVKREHSAATGAANAADSPLTPAVVAASPAKKAHRAAGVSPDLSTGTPLKEREAGGLALGATTRGGASTTPCALATNTLMTAFEVPPAPPYALEAFVRSCVGSLRARLSVTLSGQLDKYAFGTH